MYEDGEATAGFGVCSAPGACEAPVAAAAAAMLRWIDRTAEGLLAAAEDERLEALQTLLKKIRETPRSVDVR